MSKLCISFSLATRLIGTFGLVSIIINLKILSFMILNFDKFYFNNRVSSLLFTDSVNFDDKYISVWLFIGSRAWQIFSYYWIVDPFWIKLDFYSEEYSKLQTR